MKGSFSLFFESCARVDRCVLREIIRGVVVPNENAEKKKKKKKKNDVVPLLLDQFLNYLNMKPYTSILGVFYSLRYHI